ncbi:DDT domain-containing protein DDR4 [Gastrolobium bilobum]|uniref:DDT domain-containing protein DDR4 n=1 Tax=Gastrolobium bilobum TaxID=150636 RepID=UPI002AB30A4F|nr:DDT domain-containing protein DDR4 [Gastrolobium bilobum]
MQTVEEGSGGEEQNARVAVNPLESEILKLRRQWELASVLNFLDVFCPILGKDMKLSAEEIEIGLIKPDASLARLHIQLLKFKFCYVKREWKVVIFFSIKLHAISGEGTPPVSKTLNDSDKWVTALCKKLTMWWPWVAEGKIPLIPSKGEEISKYRELDPSDRLLLLKALCEVRADQHDAVSYINEALKEGTQITFFRKDALGRDGIGTSYWYDANAKGQSHRLYKGIITSDSNPKVKVKGCLSLPTINFQWETLASNLEEFSEVAEKFSFSQSAAEVAIGKKLQSDAIPILEKMRKKKERAVKQKQRQDMLLKDSQNSFCSGNARSCRTRRHISYTFEAYDRTMKEAIQLTNKRKRSPDTDQDKNRGSEDKSNIEDASTDSDSKGDVLQISDSDDTGYEIENHSNSEEDGDIDSEAGNSEAHSSRAVSYPKGIRCSKRLAGVSRHTVPESIGLTTKQRLRQRPTRNSAIESIVPDSEDDEAHEGKTDLSESI